MAGMQFQDLRLVVLVAVAFVGIITLWVKAFRNQPGQFLTWPMFSGVTFFLCDLYDDDSGGRVCLHREYAYGDLVGGEERLDGTLDFLRDRGRRVSGSVRIVSSRGGEMQIEVQGSVRIISRHG
ncbi:hypothetical protein [Curtobacterium flaccumfaciens]|uniref:hypothetical protein n=1 Tax=Curtobacterium flaccumfaciens TaxID=2035 RepID=UPI003D9A2185